MYGFNREEAQKRAEEEAMRADMKQHADKLIQGFENLKDSHAKRAIWELFQNAIDLSEKCEVIIINFQKRTRQRFRRFPQSVPLLVRQTHGSYTKKSS